MCNASGWLKSDTSLAVTPVAFEDEGWVCDSYEKTREVGKYASWAASWSYYPPEGS